jgi:hypothetical protein
MISEKYTNVTFINPFEAVCDYNNTCQTIINNKCLFHDDGHLSAFGSSYIWDFISERLNDDRSEYFVN